MLNQNFMDGFYKFCSIIARLAYLNLLWMFFILIGLGIFGLFPSTVAMFAIIRQWVIGTTEVPIYKTFWETYKQEFVKANLVGVTFYLIGIIVYIDILYFSNPTSIFTLVLYYFFWVVAFIYFLLGVFLFPVYVHYQNKWWQYYKSTFLIMLMNPLVVLAFLIILTGGGLLFRALPGLIPLFMGSGFAYILMGISFKAFNKLETLENKKRLSELQTND